MAVTDKLRPRDRRFPVRFFIATTLLAAVPLGVMLWRHQTQRPEPPYVFPSQELAALDRIVQARFAVVPTKDFGVERIGPLHELFVPETENEKAVIAALRRHRQDAAFYVISRRTFTKERGPSGYYPVQGPVYMTGKNAPPVSRRKPYGGRKPDQTWDKPPEDEHAVANPDGKPLPDSTPEAGLPEGWQLIKMAAPVLEAVNRQPAQAAVGANFKLGEWQIAAVPIRATHQACVNCHNGWNWTSKTEKIKLGDPVGIALYAVSRKSTSGSSKNSPSAR